MHLSSAHYLNQIERENFGQDKTLLCKTKVSRCPRNFKGKRPLTRVFVEYITITFARRLHWSLYYSLQW